MKLINRLKKGLVILTVVALSSMTLLGSEITEPKVLELSYAVECGIAKDSTNAVTSSSIKYQDGVIKSSELGSDAYINALNSKNKAERELQYQKDIVEYNITSMYADLVLGSKQIEVLDKQSAMAEKKLKQIEIKLAKGYASQLDYDTQQVKIAELKTSRETASENLKITQIKFRDKTNIDVSKYILDENYDYEIFNYGESTSIEAYISKYVDEYYKYDEEAAEHKKVETNEGIEYGVYTAYLLRNLNATSAEVTTEQAKLNKKQSLLSTYTSLVKTEKEIQQMKTNLELMDKNLKKAEIQYNAGYMSLLDFEDAKSNKESAEFNLLKAIYGYNLNKMLLQKPWIG